MTKERIAELKAQFPEQWQAKRAAGLPEETVAIVIQSQLDHDAAHPPHLEVIRDSRRAIEMAAAAVATALTRLSQAKASRDTTLALYPDAELPTLPSFSSDPAEFDELRISLASRETEVINLGAEITTKNERIAQLGDELKDLHQQHIKLQAINGDIVTRSNEAAEKDAAEIEAMKLRIAELETRITELKSKPKK